MLRFLEKLRAGECDVVVGCRKNGEEPLFARSASSLFWKLYKKFILHERRGKLIMAVVLAKIFGNIVVPGYVMGRRC